MSTGWTPMQAQQAGATAMSHAAGAGSAVGARASAARMMTTMTTAWMPASAHSVAAKAPRRW